MLNTLDIVIGFAVIMTVLSLFITILVQMVSTALALRGKNLANALSLTFQTIDPKIGEQAHSLAAQILRDPIFSDSIWRKKSRVVGAATQVFMEVERKIALAEQPSQANSGPTSNGPGTRPDAAPAAAPEMTDTLGKLADLVKAERELKEAVKKWATAGDSQLKQLAQAAVEAAKANVATARSGVTVPKVEPNRTEPWGFWTCPRNGARQLGTAIRPGEIYRVLHELAELTETEAALKNIPSELVTKASMLVATLAKRDRPTTEAQQKLGWLNSVSQVFEGGEAQKVALVKALPDLSATVERATTQAYDRFQRWFGSGQDRAEQWFQTHMRGVTVAMAILTAFVLQLDTVDIYRQLRDQPALTAALVKAAPGALEQGGAVFDPVNTAAYQTYLLWLGKHPLFPLKALPDKGTDAAYRQALMDRLKAGPDSDPAAPAAEATAPPAEATAKEWLAEYDLLQPAGKIAFENSRLTATQDLQTLMDATGFSLAPTTFLGRWDGEKVSGWLGPVCPLLAHYFRHIIGVLMTAGLLTLGAPFWFNLLKNLMSLRPALAALIEKRPTSAPALPQAPATPGTS